MLDKQVLIGGGIAIVAVIVLIKMTGNHAPQVDPNVSAAGMVSATNAGVIAALNSDTLRFRGVQEDAHARVLSDTMSAQTSMFNATTQLMGKFIQIPEQTMQIQSKKIVDLMAGLDAVDITKINADKDIKVTKIQTAGQVTIAKTNAATQQYIAKKNNETANNANIMGTVGGIINTGQQGAVQLGTTGMQTGAQMFGSAMGGMGGGSGGSGGGFMDMIAKVAPYVMALFGA